MRPAWQVLVTRLQTTPGLLWSSWQPLTPGLLMEAFQALKPASEDQVLVCRHRRGRRPDGPQEPAEQQVPIQVRGQARDGTAREQPDAGRDESHLVPLRVEDDAGHVAVGR